MVVVEGSGVTGSFERLAGRGPEARVVAAMKEDTADEGPVSLDACPTPTGRAIAVVGTEPAELDGRTTVVLVVLLR